MRSICDRGHNATWWPGFGWLARLWWLRHDRCPPERRIGASPKPLAAEAFPEYILIGGPFDGQRGVAFHIPMAYLELPLKRGIITALDISPIPVARYNLVEVDGYPSRDDEGTYRYQWHEAERTT